MTQCTVYKHTYIVHVGCEVQNDSVWETLTCSVLIIGTILLSELNKNNTGRC